MQIPEDSQLITTGNESSLQQQQRHTAARRPVHRITPSGQRDLSSHSFSDASKRTELTVFRKSLTSSQSIGNVVQHETEPKLHLASSAQNVLSSEQPRTLSYPKGNRNISSSLQSLPGKIPGSSILLNQTPLSHKDDDLPLPPNWEVRLTANNIRYFVDHNNQRTHWIHPLARENLPLGWTKLYDENLGVVYYNELERRSQFDHPGVATPASNIAEVHGSVQSIVPNRNKSNEDIEDLNIISETEIPIWLQMYSEADSESDGLLNFNLFKLQQLEIFDEMLLKLFKQDAINTVIKYEKPRREINSELFRRLIVR
uniref:Uncharacterized protein n=1 Tax=Panagrolaimus davidi TaxID=227884 RepID=A0A914Q5H1_9BILA